MSINDNIQAVNENIEKACASSKRKREDVLLIAVTKYVDTGRIQEAIDAGITDVGENHAQELREKLTFFKLNSTKPHFIGHLQSNKLKYLIDEAALIQSVDSIGLLEQIDKRSKSLDCIQNVLLQINIGREVQKSGLMESDLEGILSEAARFENVAIRGLMCVPPADTAENTRKYFSRMRNLLEISANNHRDLPLKELSMGMSNDYVVAVEEGATMVRVGSAIFGARDRK